MSKKRICYGNIKIIDTRGLEMKEQNKDIANNLLSYAIASRDNYVAEKHHAVVANALEGVERGDIKRLIVKSPPLAGMTELISELFPEYYLGKNSDNEVIFNTQRGVIADNIYTNIISNMNTDLYVETFPSFIPIGSYPVIRNKIGRGSYFSAVTGCALLGRRSDLIIMDTPIAGDKLDSSIYQQRLRDWYHCSLRCRLVPTGAIIICETMATNRAFSDWVLREDIDEDWTVITIPMED